MPIRTLILYSVQRMLAAGARENLLTRDIKNLVGRAGRAGSTTKGLVICANESQWPLVEAVAQQAAGEPVVGALRTLIESVRSRLTAKTTNDQLESDTDVHSLIDGIDGTLVELAAVEIGESELIRLATDLADQTFASRQGDEASKKLLRHVFTLRANRIADLRKSGRLEWIMKTGARARMVDVVEVGLLQMRPKWDDVVDPIDESVVNPVLEWAWNQLELQQAIRREYRLSADSDVSSIKGEFFTIVKLWLDGSTFAQIADGAGRSVDHLLGIHSQVLAFTLQTIVEQGIALLEQVLQSQGQMLAPAVREFSEHLRFGVPSTAGCTLAAGGITHRRAFVEIGNALGANGLRRDNKANVFDFAQRSLEVHRKRWREHLGELIFLNTMRELSSVTRRRPAAE